MSKQSPKTQLRETVNENRRTFFTVGITAIVAFAIGRAIDFTKLFTGQKIIKEASFESFDLVETTDEIRLSERGGEPIFIVDKASFRK